MDWKMIIGGKSADASDGAVLNNYNPYTGELIGTVPAATKEDVDLAIANAVEGQKEWAALRNDERDAIINKFLALYDEHAEELAQLLSREGGKTISECRGEVGSVPLIFRAYMNAAATMYGETLPYNVERRNTSDIIFTSYEPLGVCVCVAPFNYPVSTMTNKVAPALCAGNSVIMKPASDTPMSIILYAQLMLEAGMPANTVQVITGSGSKVGKWITENEHVAAISLTGSTAVGVKLQTDASRHLQRVLLELGGNDPFVVFEDCDLDKAVAEAIGGRIYNAGQICSASKRFIVQNSVKEAFIEKLIEGLKAIKCGDPLDETTVFSCLINPAAATKVAQQIEMNVAQGARCVYGGKRTAETIVEPTVLVDVTPEMDIAQSMEVFGPVFPVIGFDTFDEAMAIANNTTYGLSAGVMTGDIATAMKAARAIQSGTCVINGTGDYRTSYHGFGGYKMSGVGREGALHTLEEFSEAKTTVLRGVMA